MKALKFMDAQEASITKKGEEGMASAEICRETWISSEIYFNCKKNAAGMLPTDIKSCVSIKTRIPCWRRSVVTDPASDKEMLQAELKREFGRLLGNASRFTNLKPIGDCRSAVLVHGRRLRNQSGISLYAGTGGGSRRGRADRNRS